MTRGRQDAADIGGSEVVAKTRSSLLSVGRHDEAAKGIAKVRCTISTGQANLAKHKFRQLNG
jgi:hypothetical protein